MHSDENHPRRREAVRTGFVAAAVTAFVLTVTACSTMEGAGEDIEAAGESIQDAAD